MSYVCQPFEKYCKSTFVQRHKSRYNPFRGALNTYAKIGHTTEYSNVKISIKGYLKIYKFNSM